MKHKQSKQKEPSEAVRTAATVQAQTVLAS